MKDWKVSYAPTYDKDDLCHVSVSAVDRESAEKQAKREYHDIGIVIQITPL